MTDLGIGTLIHYTLRFLDRGISVKSVKLVLGTGQIGIVLLLVLFLFSCVSSPAICITYTCMTLSQLLAPHKLRDVGGVP
jgi:uncharacterized membrane protein